MAPYQGSNRTVSSATLSRETRRRGPEGLYAAFEVVWRGAVYGTVDALLLTAFPAVVALTLLGGRLRGLGRRLEFAALALVLT